MKILFKLKGKIETIENVSVDDKCFPLVAGIHPYAASAVQTSPLARESALWYKTLAVDSLFIDCNARLIYWLPVVADIDPELVALRRAFPSDTNNEDFIPTHAKPLFEDSGHYEFDASLKEMMGKCCLLVKKYMKRAISTEEFNKNVANILHVYILKAIVFSNENMFCLIRAKSLIDERLTKAEEDILGVADGIEKLEKCQNTLMASLLHKENMDNELYLRTCDRSFLNIFLKKVESELDRLNLNLEAEQSKVNWAKSNTQEGWTLEDLQKKRDQLFKEIEVLIKVREAIKNVVSRKEKVKRKIKSTGVVQSCFHNIFVEIDRRLTLEIQALDRLCNDKINISAARETILGVMAELKNNNRDSERDTKFDIDECVDYLDSGTEIDKPDMWLTFQERVSKVLENISSEPYKTHKINCDRIQAQINIALCEYSMTMSQTQPRHQRMLRSSSGSDVSVASTDVKFREKNKQAKNADVRSREVFINDDIHVTGADAIVMGDDNVFLRETTPRNLSGDPTDDLQLRIQSDYFAMDRQSVDLKRWSSFPSTSGLPDEAQAEDVNKGESALKFSSAKMSLGQQQLTEQLALSCLMKHVDNLKVYNQVAFREVVESLGKYLGPANLEDTSSQEQTELLWKSYERSFCQEILPDLTNLYTTVLYAGSQSAYQALSKAPLQELLKGDKILNLFFGTQPNSITKGNVNNSKSRPVDAISIAKTVSSLSLDVRHYDINDLYNLANADSSDLITHFMLEDTDEVDEHALDGSSSGSSDNFYFPGSSPMSSENNIRSGGLLGSHVSDSDIPTTDNSDSNSENWNGLYTPEQIIEVLDPVLSPFRRYVKKCLDATCFLDKVRYITKAIQDLNQDISRLYGPEHQSACDDIITMLILALSNMPEDIFIGLYVNLRLLMDILPQFLSGTLYDYNLVSLCASYDYLFTRNVCVKVLKRYPGSFKVRPSQ